MDQELLTQITDLTIYTQANLPASIGMAIYNYGDSKIREITAYIDYTGTGEKGMIITPEWIYYSEAIQGKINLKEMNSIKISMNNTRLLINNQEFTSEYINLTAFAKLLSDYSEVSILCSGTIQERIEFDLTAIIRDILEDAYEDIELDQSTRASLEEYQQELTDVHSMSEADYNYELERLAPKVYPILEELELDSEEMDDLAEVMQILSDQEAKQNEAFENAGRYYEDMIQNLKNGDPRMYNQIRSIMKMIGINEEDLNNKSPEELNAMLDEVCKKFGISREQVEAFARKYQH